MKSGLNGVAMPQFELKLTGSVATDSGMLLVALLVALEPKKPSKSIENMKIHDFWAWGRPPLMLYRVADAKNTAKHMISACDAAGWRSAQFTFVEG